jgi:two-component system, OmpR family, KDP operon response regulator KdpE
MSHNVVEPSKLRLLVIDDEATLRQMLKQYLLAAGYEVTLAAGGEQALIEIEKSSPDLIILDLVMPDKSGLEVLTEIRQRLANSVPIIVLSALEEERQKVQALDLGADDYLTKPFGTGELLARIRLAMRHKLFKDELKANPDERPKIIGDDFFSIDLDRQVVQRNGEELRLTPKQYEVLRFLALNADKVLTHRVLLNEVWGSGFSRQNEYLHVIIGQLRKKIEPDPARPRYILTEPGKGYRFRLGK